MSKYIKLEDAIEQVKTEFYGGGYQEWLEISIDNLINRIANLPTFEVSEDCISREGVYRAIITCGEVDNDLNHLYKVIENEPSVVPSRADGEWVRNFDGNEWYWYCTNCKEQWYEDDLWMGGNEFPNYCPNCGAKMK